jgi:hypothetical protein
MHNRGGSASSHSTVPSELEEQMPSGLSRHAQPASQSASVTHAVRTTWQVVVPVFVHVQRSVAVSSGTGSLASSPGVGRGSLPEPDEPPEPLPSQRHDSDASHVKPAPQSFSLAHGSHQRGTHCEMLFVVHCASVDSHFVSAPSARSHGGDAGHSVTSRDAHAMSLAQSASLVQSRGAHTECSSGSHGSQSVPSGQSMVAHSPNSDRHS